MPPVEKASPTLRLATVIDALRRCGVTDPGWRWPGREARAPERPYDYERDGGHFDPYPTPRRVEQ